MRHAWRWLALIGGLLVPLLIAAIGWWQPASVALDIGGRRDARYIHDFFENEGQGEASGRWTRPDSALTIPASGWPSVLDLRLAFAPTIRYAHLTLPGGTIGLPTPDAENANGVQAIRSLHLLLASDQRWSGDAVVRFATADVAASDSDPRPLGLFLQTARLDPIDDRAWLPPLSMLLALLLITALCWLIVWIGGDSWLWASLGAALIGGGLAWAWGWQRLWVAPYLWPIAAGLLWPVVALLLARLRWHALIPAPALIGLLVSAALGMLLWVFARDGWVAMWSWRGIPLLALPIALLLIVARPGARRWLAGSLAAIALVYGVFSYVNLFAGDWARDFAPLFRGPRALWRGESLYTLDELRLNPFSAVYKYPPFFALIMGPFTPLSPGIAFQSWKAFQVALVALAAWLIWSAEELSWRRWSSLWLLIALALFQPIIDTIRYGQVDAILLATLAGALWAIRRDRWWLFGVLIAIATLTKLYPAYLLVLPLVRRRWQGIAGFAGALAVLLIVGVAAMGLDVHLVYLREVLPLSGGGTGWIENQTINGFLNRLTATTFGLEPAGGPRTMLATYLAAAALTLLALWWSRTLDDGRAFGLLIVTMLIVLPVSWIHYQTILLIPLIGLFAAIERDGGATWSHAVPLALAWALLCFGNQWAFYGRALYGPFWQLILSYKLYGLLLLFGAIGLPQRAAEPRERAVRHAPLVTT